MNSTKFIPINIPIVGEEERKAADSVLETGVLTDASYSGGKFVREFERKLREVVGSKHAIAVNSGTSALHTSLMAYGVGPGDEVIVPAFTFEATANVVLACGAKPVFADVLDDYTMDPADVARKITERTKAIIPVHVYGYPAPLDELREVAESRSIKVIEDAAESLGAEYKGRQTGYTDHAGCFSLYATKVITSSEGGAITTNDDAFADNVRLIRNHGMREGYDTRVLGFNYRMPEILAAIASVQMDKLERFIAARRRNAILLTEEISRLEGVTLTQTGPDRKHIYYLFTVHVETSQKKRDELLDALRKRDVGAAVYWKTTVNRMPLYERLGYANLELPGSYDAADRVLSLPVHPGVTPEQCDYIVKEFARALMV